MADFDLADAEKQAQFAEAMGAGGAAQQIRQKIAEQKARGASAETDRRAAQLKGYEQAREADMAKGRARGEEIFKEGALGRVNEGRSADIQDVIARRKANLAGFTPEEQAAYREKNLSAVNQAAQGQLRAMRGSQAASGVRGATASAQRKALAKDFGAQAAQNERDLYLSNINQRREALGQFEKSATGAEANELEKQKYNIAQKNAELQGKLATEFGYAQLGSADRTAVAQEAAARYSADAQRDAAKAAGKKK